MKLRYIIIDRPGKHDHVATWRGRCTYCGHRVGANIRQTREQPWRIPSELVLRFLAMRQARDVAWIEAASTQNPNQHPEDIHIIHNADIGWNYWFQQPNGFLYAGTGYRTEGKAWRAALLMQEHDDATNEDYPN